LLLLLVALLPFRAVMAASMLCLPLANAGSSGFTGHHDVQVLAVGALAPVEDHHAHPVPGAQTGEAAQEPSPAGGLDCNLCAGFCSLPPLASAPPDLRHPQAEAALYPADSAAAPSHVSDGQKRPPRTI
jgi:hypothetical protein